MTRGGSPSNTAINCRILEFKIICSLNYNLVVRSTSTIVRVTTIDSVGYRAACNVNGIVISPVACTTTAKHTAISAINRFNFSAKKIYCSVSNAIIRITTITAQKIIIIPNIIITVNIYYVICTSTTYGKIINIKITITILIRIIRRTTWSI